MDLTLPRIEPAQPVRSAANEIDRAGAQFKQAADAVATVLTETDKARIAVESQEASIQASKGLHDTLQTIQTKPYVKPEEVTSLFGGQVPASIDLTEPVPGQSDPNKRQPRKIVPMHEIAVPLFEQRAQQVVADAARNVTDEPWRRNFERAVAKDVEAKRVEAMDWQKAQFLADQEIRSVAHFRQAVAARDWPGVEAILNNAKFTMDVKTREGLRAELPSLRTKAVVEDRLRGAQTPEELDKLTADIAGNAIGDGSEKFAKLSPEEQYQFSVTVRHRRQELVNEQIAARKAAREGMFQKYGNIAFEALKLSQQYGQPATKYWSVSQISAEDNAGMDFNDKMTLLNALAADPKRPDDPIAILELNTTWGRPGALGKLSPQTMWSYGPRLSPQKWMEWLDRWSKDRAEPGSVKSPVTEAQMAHVGRYVETFLNTSAKDKPQEFEVKKGAIIQMLVENAMSPNPRPVNSAMDVAAIAAGRFDDSKQKMTGDVILRNGLAFLAGGAGRVTDQMVADHKKLVKAEEPLVDEAYKALVADATPNEEWRARVHVILANPVNLQMVKEQLRAQPGANPEDKRQQIMQITKNERPSADSVRQYAAGVEEDATKARQLEQEKVEEERQRAEQKAAKEAARKAESDRRQALPVWERYADEAVDAESRRRFEVEREQVRARYGRDPVDQTPFAIRTPAPDYGRADAVAEQKRPEIEQQVKAEYEAHKGAFREFMKAVEAKDPVAVELAQRFFLDTSFQSFKKYVDLRKKGEVY